MTPEEEIARLLALSKQGNFYNYQAPTMSTQISGALENLDPAKLPTPDDYRRLMTEKAGQSTRGREAQLKSQMAYANSLRGREMPKGKTVGPSGIYVNNVWDNAAAAFDRLVGGYLAGRAAKEGDAIDRIGSEAGAAKAELDRMDTLEGYDFKREQSGLDRAVQQAIAADRNATTVSEGALDRAAAGARNQATIDANAAAATAERENNWDLVSLTTPDGPKTIAYNDQTGAAHWGTKEGPKLTPQELADSVKYQASTGGGSTGDYNDFVKRESYKAYLRRMEASDQEALDYGSYVNRGLFDEEIQIRAEEREAERAAADRVREEEKAAEEQADLSAEELEKVTGGLVNLDYLNSDLLETATGIGPGRWFGEVGLGADGRGPEVQEIQRQITTEQLGGLVPALAAADLTPVSDTDVKKLEQQFANVGTQPYGHVGFQAIEGRREALNRWNKAIEDGAKTEAQRDAWMNQFDLKVAVAAARWGYEPEKLIAAGFDPELVEYALLLDEKRREEEKGR